VIKDLRKRIFPRVNSFIVLRWLGFVVKKRLWIRFFLDFYKNRQDNSSSYFAQSGRFRNTVLMKFSEKAVPACSITKSGVLTHSEGAWHSHIPKKKTASIEMINYFQSFLYPVNNLWIDNFYGVFHPPKIISKLLLFCMVDLLWVSENLATFFN